MQKLYAVAAAFVLSCFTLDTATAQIPATNFHTWFAPSGQNTTTCGTVADPCLFLGYAYARTRAGGSVQCKDNPVLDLVTIQKSITIICDTSATTTTGGTYVMRINTGPNDLVTLIGINSHGAEFNYGYSVPAVEFSGSGTLVLERVDLSAWFSGSGVLFQPNGPAKLIVNDSSFTRNGGANVGAAIRVVPQGNGTAQVSINNSRISGNVFGIAVDGSSSTGGINATIRDSVMSGNQQDGVIATSNAAPIGVNIVNSASLNNAFGVRSIGSNVTVRVEGTKIIGNGIGVGGGGALLTGGGNTVQGNANNGGFTGSYAQQ